MFHSNMTKSTVAILITNIIPLIGVLFLKWNVTALVILYWIENIIIGFYTILKIVKSSNTKIPTKHGIKTATQKEMNKIKLFVVPFFIFHYSIFMIGHFFFINFLLKPQNIPIWGYFIPFLSMIISHTISYKEEYLHNKEYMNIDPVNQMFKPYKRIIIMHVVIILSTLIVIILLDPFKSTIIPGFILIFVKTCADFLSHKKRVQH